MDQEDLAIQSLTGFGLDGVLSGLSLPSASSLSNELGLSGLSGFDPSWLSGDGAIGMGQGEDFEEEVDNELGQEEDVVSVPSVKDEVRSPWPSGVPPRKKRKVARSKENAGSGGPSSKMASEEPRGVNDLYPWFEPGKILNFTNLFPESTAKKHTVNTKPLQSMAVLLAYESLNRLTESTCDHV